MGITSVMQRWPAGDTLTGLRDQLLVSRRFLDFATAFPPFRRVARRRARELFDLCAGFVYSQVLAACLRLDLFAEVGAAPAGAEELARRTGLPLVRLQALLDAAVDLRLLERRRGDRYGLGPLGAALVANPGVGAMVRHHDALYRDLADPVALIRDPGAPTALSAYWPYARNGQASTLDEDSVAAYSDLMAASQPLVASEILAAYPIARHRCLLDVGGGDGAFLLAVAQAAPRLRLELFDLPAVADRARARFDAAGLGERARVSGGDFLQDPIPEGADLISLVRILHDHDDAAVRRLLAKVYAALPPNGRLLVAEPMLGDGVAERGSGAYFALYLLAMGQGRPRRFDVLEALVREAGFRDVRRLRTRIPLQTGALVASR